MSVPGQPSSRRALLTLLFLASVPAAHVQAVDSAAESELCLDPNEETLASSSAAAAICVPTCEFALSSSAMQAEIDPCNPCPDGCVPDPCQIFFPQMSSALLLELAVLECLDAGLCPSGQVGAYVNDLSVCRTTPRLCGSGTYGVEPSCHTVAVCTGTTTGVRVDNTNLCVATPRLCGAGTYGVEPNCHTVALCTGATVGVRVDSTNLCVATPQLCDSGTYGVEPSCHTLTLCTGGTVGAKVDGTGLCLAPPAPCPAGSIGVQPACLDPGACRAGTRLYSGSDGTQWCASPEEIRQDSIPGTPYPAEQDEAVSMEVEDTTNLVELEEPIPDFYLPAAAASGVVQVASSVPTCSRYQTTCDVVFIRGYDFGDYSGYGGFGAAFGFFANHGYDVRALDTYGRCVDSSDDDSIVVAVPTNSGDHDTWFPADHSAGTTCSPGNAHNKDTDIRHMAYHVAWWLYDTYGTQPVDVIAHSMGGLITRYAITMSGRDIAFPPKLNVEDVVTAGTPHKGFWFDDSTPTTDQLEQMSHESGFMTYMRGEAQDPQGLAGTDWTLIGADEDNAVSEDNARGMTAAHKIRYNQNCCGGWADGGYDHDEYFLDDNEADTTTYYWKNAESSQYYDNHAAHSVKRMYWGTVAVTH